MNQQTESSDHSSLLSEKMSTSSDISFDNQVVGKRHVSPSLENCFYENSFVIEDSFNRSRMSKATHWSVLWSDLMMTMFVLFLSLFVYQVAHEEFLVNNSPEIIGGSTTEALEVESEMDLIVPLTPLKNKAPLITAGTIKKVEIVTMGGTDLDKVFQEKAPLVNQPEEPEIKQETTQEKAELLKPDKSINEDSSREKSIQILSSIEDIIKPATIISVEEETSLAEEVEDRFKRIYDNSQEALYVNKLSDFASVDLVPDTTMRIILTGDLLFSTGQADLSRDARESLRKIAKIIKDTPYMINVIGHTDNQPMHSTLYATNWELSVVRATRVARFLIEEMGMKSNQFIVSGYGANRPRIPNTNVINRAKNRRVEIIISKRLPPVIKATSNNMF
ncbi:MAG: OmpA family protein [Desulfobulbaceae bacterium]|nr:OmpA family protein [Desulfobulbaceae bacterium]